MKVKFVYVNGPNYNQQEGRISSVRVESDAVVKYAEANGFGQATAVYNEKNLGVPFCCDITDWIEVSFDDLYDIFIKGLRTVSVLKKELSTRIDDARTAEYAEKLLDEAK